MNAFQKYLIFFVLNLPVYLVNTSKYPARTFINDGTSNPALIQALVNDLMTLNENQIVNIPELIKAKKMKLCAK